MILDHFQQFERRMMEIIKDELERAPFILDAAIEAHLDDHGPPKGTLSVSDQVGKQSGNLSRSLVPNADNNLTEVRIEGLRGVLMYGTEVFYALFLEEGTERMRARPYFGPGFEDFAQDFWEPMLERIMQRAIEEFNG